jgi:hypothetical protein
MFLLVRNSPADEDAECLPEPVLRSLTQRR